MALIPQFLSSYRAGEIALWIFQRPRGIELVLEFEDQCQRITLPSRQKSRSRNICRGKRDAPPLSFTAVPLLHPTSASDVYGYFESQSRLLVLPIAPSLQDQGFKELWKELKPKYVFLVSYGKFKKDLKYWLKGSPIWFLPNSEKSGQRTGQSLDRRDWPTQFRFYKDDIPFPNHERQVHSKPHPYTR